MTKEQKKIKELTANVEALTKQLEDANAARESIYNSYSRVDKELRDLHNTFDVLGIPKDVPASPYSNLTASSRMTLYIAGVRENVKDKGD